MVRSVNVKKTKKFKENHPENYHVHDNKELLENSEKAKRKKPSRSVSVSRLNFSMLHLVLTPL